MWADFFLPTTCAGCNIPLLHGANICEECAGQLRYAADFRCSTCGARCPDGETHHSGSLSILAATPFDATGVATLVHRLKFSRATLAAKPMGIVLAHALQRHPQNIAGCTLVPIPLSPKRLRERGYNQAQLLAEEICRLTNLPIADNALARIKHTDPQTEIKPEERENNVANIFEASPAVAGKKIILIDDVVTTGATLLSAARTLRLSHARPVVAVVFAASPYSPVCPRKGTSRISKLVNK